MARSLRFQYPGTIYHVMARGGGGKTVFENKDDCEIFLHRLGETCGSCGWQLRAWVLMGNHSHFLLEMVLPRSVSCMLGEVKRNKNLGKRLNELEYL